MSTYSLIVNHPIQSDKYIAHHGILGQKWGVRRFQNKDGSLTTAGKKRYGSDSKTLKANGEPRIKSLTSEQKEKVNKIIKLGTATVATGLAAYGTYKLASTGQLNKAVKIGKSVVDKAMESAKQSVKSAPSNLKNEVKDWVNISKEAKKQAYVGLKEGIPEGARGTGKTFGKAISSGITWMAGIELADLMTNGAVTQTILTAYNDHQKKENKVKTSYRNSRKTEDD